MGGRVGVRAGADPAKLKQTHGRTYEPDDGTPGGWDHRDLARAIGRAVGRRVLALPVPRGAMLGAAWLDARVRGRAAKLTRDRAAYFCHPDWAVGAHAAPPADVWRARVPTEAGLAETAASYRAAGWL